ncbi:MAG: type IV-A pilus assembly ATPase PilB [Vibrio sp.]
MTSNLITILNRAELLTSEQQAEILEQTSHITPNIPLACVQAGYISSEVLLEQLSNLFHLSVVDIEQYDYQQACYQLGIRELITHHQALPLNVNNNTVLLAIADPTNQDIDNDFRFATGKQIDLVLADCKQLDSAIRRLYGKSVHVDYIQGKDITQDELENLVEMNRDEFQVSEDFSQYESPVSRFINQVLLDAVRKGASDIHFEPYEDQYRVRLRCDGILVEAHNPAPHLSRRLAARLKILSKLDIAERRLPQDGRINIRLNENTAVDMRVSTLPTLWGEKVVLRLLNSNETHLNIDKLGYNDTQKQLYLDALSQPQGMILMTGPTGSGKTVSLYTGLNILNTPDKNISTAEDPVEINLTGINQVQVKPKIGFTFASALRAFLRQDPDVVMIGEIRDLETAEMAIKAAQTGHLVLSTLHTNSAAETVVRLTNMGIETFNLTSSLSLIIAQRLVRCLCTHCKVEDPQSNSLCLQFNLPVNAVLYQASPHGCTECTNGYSGRTGIYEMMRFSQQITEAIFNRLSAKEIEKIAQQEGMMTLQESGIEKLKQGVTSFSELQRVLYFNSQ